MGETHALNDQWSVEIIPGEALFLAYRGIDVQYWLISDGPGITVEVASWSQFRDMITEADEDRDPQTQWGFTAWRDHEETCRLIDDLHNRIERLNARDAFRREVEAADAAHVAQGQPDAVGDDGVYDELEALRRAVEAVRPHIGGIAQ